MSIQLKSLRLKAFRSFAEESVIDFPETGLVLVRGKNLDTNGSSGSGKSSFLLGLTYAFGHCPFPATALQSWLTETPMEVAVTFVTAAGEIILSRGAKTSLQVDGNTVKGSVKAVEETLQRALGLQPELLEALTYRGQKRRSLFLSKNDADKKEFLSQVLGLDRFEAAADAAADAAKALTQELKTKVALVDHAAISVRDAEARCFTPTYQDIEGLFGRRTVMASSAHAATMNAALLAQQVAAAQAAVNEAAAGALAGFVAEDSSLQSELALVAGEKAPPANEAALQQALDSQKECASRLERLMTADAQRQKEHGQQVRDLEFARANVDALCRTESQVEATIEALSSEIAHLLRATCPTCMRSWEQGQAKLVELEDHMAGCEEQLKAIGQARQDSHRLDMELMDIGTFVQDPLIPRFQTALQSIVETVATERHKIIQQRTAFEQEKARRTAEIQGRRVALKERIAAAVQAATAEANATLSTAMDSHRQASDIETRLRADLSALDTQLASTEAANKQMFELHQQALASVAAAEARMRELAYDAEDVERRLQVETDFAGLVGREGFLGAIFDEVLAEIAEATNAILAAVPNTSNVSIQFKTESFTQKGTTKKTIVPVVSIGGHEAPMASGLSGGMTTTVELAVDLAITEVVGRRTGSAPGWLILDESFDGLGLVEKEACLEILQKFAENRLLLVVDHDTAFKEMFTKTIEIECSNGISRVGKSNVQAKSDPARPVPRILHQGVHLHGAAQAGGGNGLRQPHGDAPSRLSPGGSAPPQQDGRH